MRRQLGEQFLPTPSIIPGLPRTTEATRALMLAELALFHGLMPMGGYQDVLVYCRPLPLASGGGAVDSAVGERR